MSSFNLILVLAVLACVCVFASARNLANKPSLRSLLPVVGAVAIALLLAAANLSNEWAIRRVAGEGFTEPSQVLQASKAAGGEAGAMNAYTAGILETSFNRGREDAMALGVAVVLCLVSGLWLGRKRSQPPTAASATVSRANAA